MYADLSIKEFLAETAANSPVPGGGSAAALCGALAAALTEMVANLTAGKEKYAEYDGQMRTIATEAATLREQFTRFIDEDSQAYARLLEAYKLPGDTEALQAARHREIQQATLRATLVPMKIAEELSLVVEAVIYVAHKGNQNALADACAAMMAARACILASLLNVRINLRSIDDKTFVRQMQTKATHLESEIERIETKLKDWVKTKLE